MAGQVHANVRTIRKIADAVTSYEEEGDLPFTRQPAIKTKGFRGIEAPKILNWISGSPDSKTHPCGAETFEKRLAIVRRESEQACQQAGMDKFQNMGCFETGGNVSDRRFMLETFAMFGIEDAVHPADSPPTTVQIDMKDIYDPKYFMPYVPGYVVSGGSLALFSITAADGDEEVPTSGEQQVAIVIRKTLQVLARLGASFDDVVLLWNRATHLDEDEESILMMRSRLGLNRPLAESVLEIGRHDSNGIGQNGAPLRLEYIVLAQIPISLPQSPSASAPDSKTQTKP